MVASETVSSPSPLCQRLTGNRGVTIVDLAERYSTA
jgi:hypothetical protein